MSELRIVAATAGLGAGVFLPIAPPWWGLILLVLLSGLALYLYANKKIIFLLALFIIGLCLSVVRLGLLADKQLPPAYENIDLTLTIVIRDLPQQTENNTRFKADVIHSAPVAWTEAVRLSWYQAPLLAPGETWRVTARLRRPRGLSNPGTFDYQAWLLANKIYATGYVRADQGNTQLAQASAWSFAAVRYWLQQRLFLSSSLRYRAFLQALVLGERSDMSTEHWRVLQATGTVHLMAISGLHIGLVAGIGFVLGGLVRRITSLLWGSRPTATLLAPVFSILLAGIYAGLAGFAIPTQRALCFVILVNLAYLLGRRINPYYLLAMCGLAVVAIDPFAFLATGFWLSFGAVAILFYQFTFRIGRRAAPLSLLAAQGVLFVGMLVPLALLNLPVSALSPLANLVAVPLVSVIVIPLLLAAVLSCLVYPPLALLLLNIADRVFHFIWLLLEFIANQSAIWWPSVPSIAVALPLGLSAVTLLLLPRGLPGRVLGAALMLLFLLPVERDIENFSLTAMDVGQGLALVVETPTGSLLYDSGARFSANFDVGSRIVAPYLRSRDIGQLEQIIISHADNDHAGGLTGLLALVATDSIISGQQSALQTLVAKFPVAGDNAASVPNIEQCVRDMVWQFGDLTIRALWPPTEEGLVSGVDFNKSNNQSCVLLLEIDQRLILLPGDIEADAEAALLALGKLPSNIDILIAPHHGSLSSSTRAFVRQLAPRFVVYSAGFKNRYGHPHPKIVERYLLQGAAGYNTATLGAVRFEINKAGMIDVIVQRERQRRIWQ